MNALLSSLSPSPSSITLYFYCDLVSENITNALSEKLEDDGIEGDFDANTSISLDVLSLVPLLSFSLLSLGSKAETLPTDYNHQESKSKHHKEKIRILY